MSLQLKKKFETIRLKDIVSQRPRISLFSEQQPASSSGKPRRSVSDDNGSDDGGVGARWQLKRQLTRAEIIRRKTLLQFDKHLNLFNGSMEPRLFDRVLLVKLVKRDFVNGLPYGDIKCNYVPCIAQTFPDKKDYNFKQEQSTNVDCPDLFIPDFTRAKGFTADEPWPGDEEFTLTLTDESGKRTYAYCVRHLVRFPPIRYTQAATVKRSDLPQVLAVISPIYAPQFYIALARECVSHLTEGWSTLKNFLETVYHRKFPADGSALHVLEKTRKGSKRNIVIQGQGPPILGGKNCSSVVRRMGPEVTVATIVSLLAEQRIVIAGDSVESLSHAFQSIISLLQPFSWPYTLIPVLPDSLLEIVNSPTPYLVGILRTNMHKLKALITRDNRRTSDDLMQDDDLVVIDLDGGIFVPQLAELYDASDNEKFKVNNAFELCRKLLAPKKLVEKLAAKIKQAITVSDTAHADILIQKTMLWWFASLIWPYKKCSFNKAFVAEAMGDNLSLRICKSQLLASHTSKPARRFMEWFVETGIFREWIREKTDESEANPPVAEDLINKKFDEYVIAHTNPQARMAKIFMKAQNAVLHPHLFKKS